MSNAVSPDELPGRAGIRKNQLWHEDSPGIEIYADSSNISATFYSIIMEFGLSQRNGPNQLVARVRMSPEHAKTFALVLLHGLNEHEKAMGYRVPVPEEILDQIHIEDFLTEVPVGGRAVFGQVTNETALEDAEDQ